MALFGSQNRHHPDSDTPSGRYSAVGDEEESKPLRTMREHHGSSDDDINQHSEDNLATTREIYALSRSLRRTNLFLKVIIGLLCITIIALLSMNIPESVRKIIKSASCAPDRLLKSPVPPLALETKIFEKSPIYSQRPNAESDAAWDGLLPSGRGFVYIPDWKDYDLPPGQNTSFGMIYSTALFHQMHCLGQLRRFSYMFLDAIVRNKTDEQEKIAYMFDKMDHQEHMSHCFDYLRQTIQCAGDMAMEWPRTEPDGERFAVDGWGIPHECKSWDTIMSYMNEKHFDHSMVSDIAPIFGSTGEQS